MDVAHEVFECEVLPLLPAMRDDVAEQNVLRRLDGIGFDVHEAEHRGNGAFDAVCERFGVIHDLLRRAIQRTENRHGQTRVAAGRVDRHIDGLAQFFDAVGALAPIAKAFLPSCGLRHGVIIWRLAFATRFVLIDPRAELLSAEIGEGEQRIAEIALGVDGDDRNAVDGRFFEQREAQAGLAGAGHAEHHAVRDEVL